jgi:hypothetical protein
MPQFIDERVQDIIQKAKNKKGVAPNRKPHARDGHTAIIVQERYLLVFGGDRHSMPFNDLHILDLE